MVRRKPAFGGTEALGSTSFVPAGTNAPRSRLQRGQGKRSSSPLSPPSRMKFEPPTCWLKASGPTPPSASLLAAPSHHFVMGPKPKPREPLATVPLGCGRMLA